MSTPKKNARAFTIMLLMSLLVLSVPLQAKDRNESTLKKIIMFLPNRAFDLLDCVRANIALGFGIGGNVRATESLQVGAALYHTSRFGLSNERLEFVFHEFSIEAGLGPAYARVSNKTRDFFEVGATIHLGVIGAEAAINVDEVCDFIFGWFMYDYSEDDL